MIALRDASWLTPIASVTTVTAGRPSGIAATASATAVRRTSPKPSPRARLAIITNATTMPARMTNWWARPSSWRCKGVFSVGVDARRPAIRPISVRMPVFVTRISPRPRVTVVFMNACEWRSPIGASGLTGSVFFSLGWLSPVSADSSTSRLLAKKISPSAGSRSPASTRTTSPGTMLSVGTIMTVPSRRTRTCAASILRNASSDFSARFSWRNPITALKTTTTRTTSGVFNSPDTTSETNAAPIRMRIRRSLNWARNFFHAGTDSAAARAFGPNSARRRSASAEERPTWRGDSVVVTAALRSSSSEGGQYVPRCWGASRRVGRR